jgi:hypothetical protein
MLSDLGGAGQFPTDSTLHRFLSIHRGLDARGACVFWGQLHFFPSCRTDGTSGTCDWLGDACSWSLSNCCWSLGGVVNVQSCLAWSSSFSRPQPQSFPSFSPFSAYSFPIHPHSLVRSYPSTFLSSAWCCLSSNLSLSRSLLNEGSFFFFSVFQPSPNFDSPRSPIQNPRLCLKVRNHHPVF